MKGTLYRNSIGLNKHEVFGVYRLRNCFVFNLQWFGNIVTMDWWDDLWLNEGFASFFEYVGVEAAEHEWGMVSTCLNHSNIFLNRQYLPQTIQLH